MRLTKDEELGNGCFTELVKGLRALPSFRVFFQQLGNDSDRLVTATGNHLLQSIIRRLRIVGTFTWTSCGLIRDALWRSI